MEIRVDCVILQRYIPSSIFWSGHSDSFWFCFRRLNVLNWLQPRSIRVQHRNPMHGIKWFPIHTSRIWPKLHGARWTNVFHAAHFRIYPLLDFWGSDCSMWNLDILISLSRNWISRTFHLSFLEWKVYVSMYFFFESIERISMVRMGIRGWWICQILCFLLVERWDDCFRCFY